MLLLTSTLDKVQVVSGSAGAVKVHASWVDNNGGTITPGRTNTPSITTAATTDVVAAPAASTQRNVKHLNIRNTHASVSNLITVQHTDGTTVEELWVGTLLAGEAVVLDQEGDFQLYDVNGVVKAPSSKLDIWLRVTADVINATTAFADITGLTTPLKSGKTYAVEAHLFHTNDASTTGSRFSYNIGAVPTVALFGNNSAVTNSVTAGAFATGTATARDTAITAQTTGQTAIGNTILGGYIQPSADGTFALRCASEVAVAAGVTIKAGSWMHIRETDN